LEISERINNNKVTAVTHTKRIGHNIFAQGNQLRV